MNKKDAFLEINQLQDEYVTELVRILNDPDYSMMKTINFTSPTGTGKTKMMSKLINRFPNVFFIVTTLSKGQLHIQVRTELNKDCKTENFYVYGSADYRINSKLDAEDIISRIPEQTKCIWLRDEGHIATNRWDELLLNVCFKVINFSATNTHNDVLCNFTQTMMLRTVNQTTGTPEDAINRLLEVKKAHKDILNYNPCAIFRCIDSKASTEKRIIELCKNHHLKYINITDDEYVMSELCEDDNEYDVIINKFKIVEGIDIRRAHVLYMDNQPKNNATTIQAIGRCRRNALLYRDDIDIFAAENEELLKQTRECYVYYNVESMSIDTDENGELFLAFCNHVSCEALKANTVITVKDGQLPNGLYILELDGKTGTYKIAIDKNTGFNVIEPLTDFYDDKSYTNTKYFYGNDCKISADNVKKLPKSTKNSDFWSKELKEFGWKEGEPYYVKNRSISRQQLYIPKDKYDLSPLLAEFCLLKEKYTKQNISKRLSALKKTFFLNDVKDTNLEILTAKEANLYVTNYFEENTRAKGLTEFYRILQNIESLKIQRITRSVPLDKVLNNHSILLIKYCLIKQRESKRDNSSIKWNIKRFLYKVEELLRCKSKINWNAVVYAELNPQYSDYSIQDDLRITCELECVKNFDEAFVVNIEAVHKYFAQLEKQLFSDSKPVLYLSKDKTIDNVLKKILKTENNLKRNMADRFSISYSSLFEPLTKEEQYLIKKGFIKCIRVIPKSIIDQGYIEYTKSTNDRESAIIGTDIMQQIKNDDNEIIWTESKSVTSKIGRHNKLNRFISQKYADELTQASSQYFNGKNNFVFDTRCNSMIGYCVEYYSKYMLYGRVYLEQEIQQAIDEFHARENDVPWYYNYKSKEEFVISNGLMDRIIVRACMLKYKELMIKSFGYGAARIISSIPADRLVTDQYSEFVSLIIELGKRTANYVLNALYLDGVPSDKIDPVLSIDHIAGLADYITEDTILDVKVRNNIDENCVRQVLAYHYLSTKRSDLHIKRVIVYDAVSNKAVEIDISKNNIV